MRNEVLESLQLIDENLWLQEALALAEYRTFLQSLNPNCPMPECGTDQIQLRFTTPSGPVYKCRHCKSRWIGRKE